ncbi:T9SS C-terminal target domain-containing protein [Chryseobacterium shandongense]|uniref:T9SS C-terminal target domain-containing protein n=1 Tax=Chryseobacterium shandongense TaxID=1493872 RepID=A0AAD0YD29_9FLAO|nr:T9SS type A sorting domain-containing protein [Chryseobacterium shandongense]AZA86083.1 T9SS C-terminal target domain-containing protein [Chryseobacterium shandongense]AZA94491.1 T9SS C-terminal target domain-containing protein [Chryseobacterium shandongense]
MRKIFFTFSVAALCFSGILDAQNIVKNGSFEDGATICNNNGPFYLGQNTYVDFWTGVNVSQPSNAPVNTGGIKANNASCFFGQFPSGISTPYGNRAINIYLEHYWDVGSDARAIGQFTTGTLVQGTYKLCLSALGFPNLPYTVPNNYNTLQVVLVKEGTTQEKLVGEFNIPANNGSQLWQNYGNVFNISAAEAEVYDRVHLRFKPASSDLYPSGIHYNEGAFIDNIIIGPVSSTVTPCDNESYDLAASDNDADVGAEPYLPSATNWNVWLSNDIWNRKTNSGLNITPENPAYSTLPKHNVMRFRVRNIGNTVSQPSFARLYWTMGATGETWDTNINPASPPTNTATNSWDGSKCIINPTNNNCIVAGGELKDVSTDFNPNAQAYVPSKGFPIPSLQPGQEYIIDANWHPVNPAAFGDPNIISNPMICFLGRINDANDPMFGEYATTSSTPFRDNIKNNNNIVTRNTALVKIGRNEGFYDPFSVYSVNDTKHDAVFNLNFGEIISEGKPFEHIGLIKVRLDEILWNRWIQGGASGEGIQIYNSEKRELLINPTSGRLNNILLKAGEYRALNFSFGLKADNDNVSNHHFTFSQRLASDPANEYGSVCNFLVELNNKQEESGTSLCDKGKDCDSYTSDGTVFKGDIVLSPNPSSENTTLDFELLTDNIISVVIADLYGNILKRPVENQNYKSGTNTVEFSVIDLKEGIYVVAVIAGGETKSKQLIKK